MTTFVSDEEKVSSDELVLTERDVVQGKVDGFEPIFSQSYIEELCAIVGGREEQRGMRREGGGRGWRKREEGRRRRGEGGGEREEGRGRRGEGGAEREEERGLIERVCFKKFTSS